MSTPDQVFQQAVQAHMGGAAATARQLYLQVLQRQPGHADALHLLGLIELQAGDPAKAKQLILRAIAARQDFAAFHSNLGTVHMFLGEREDARRCFRHAVELEPRNLDALRNLGNLALELNDFEEAARCFGSIVGNSPAPDGEALGLLALAMSSLCQWDVEADLLSSLRAVLEVGEPPVRPFSCLMLDTSAAEQLACARRFAERQVARAMATPGATAYEHAPKPTAGRLKVGYLSQCLRSHAISFLMAELFEMHDRARVEVFVYDDGGDDGSDVARRIRAGAEHVRAIGGQSPWQAAKTIHDDGLDVLVDVDGFTARARHEIFALRPAPVQVSYLGYPGTSGSPVLDYVIGDAIVTPFTEHAHFSERIVQLPHCYQVNDRKRAVARPIPDRAACGLPGDAVVLCCFNQGYKIRQPTFQIWLEVLKAVPDTVLWLLDMPATARQVLAEAARAAGVDPARVIFAPRLPTDQHMARCHHADLFLDTLPYNAHTTASDALWSGVPVLTCAGSTFASRVAASTLHAVGLAQLVTADPTAYRTEAIRLASDRAALAELRTQLAANLPAAPLFDTPALVRALEDAYLHMRHLHTAGQPPRAFAIGQDGSVSER